MAARAAPTVTPIFRQVLVDGREIRVVEDPISGGIINQMAMISATLTLTLWAPAGTIAGPTTQIRHWAINTPVVMAMFMNHVTTSLRITLMDRPVPPMWTQLTWLIWKMYTTLMMTSLTACVTVR